MEIASSKQSYSSPRHKLINFFRNSRDKWKAKALEAKATIKKLQNRIRFLESSKEQWKEKYKEQEAEVARLKAQLESVEGELEVKKKSKREPS